MQPTENAFDRVKSLLGKMDRSIDDARRRRLHDPEDDPDDRGTHQSHTDDDQTAHPATNGDSHATSNGESTPMQAPARPSSKYGRARPLNEIQSQSDPDRQTA